MTRFRSIQRGRAETFNMLLLVWMISKIHAVIYQDFEDVCRNERQASGILHLGDDFKPLNNAVIENHSQQFESFYVDFWDRPNEGIDDIALFCINFKDYPRGRNVFIRVRDGALNFFAECLKNRSKGEHREDFQKLTVLTDVLNVPQSLDETYETMKNISVGFGLIVSKTLVLTVPSETIFFSKKAAHVDVYVVKFEIQEPLYYDYNDFANMLDSEFGKVMQAFTGAKSHIIVKLTFSEKYSWWTNSYKALLSEFLCEWGSRNVHSVIHREYSVLTEMHLNDVFSQSLMLTLFSSGFTDDEYLIMFANRDLCADFNSILLQIGSHHEIIYDQLLKMAVVSSTYPCNITWNVLWDFNHTSSVFAANLQHLSNIKSLYPGLIRNIFGMIPRELWTDNGNISPLKMTNTAIQYENASLALDNALKLLIAEKIDNKPETTESSYEEFFYDQYLNTSTGLYTYVDGIRVTPTFLNELSKRLNLLGKAPVLIYVVYTGYGGFDGFRDCNVYKNRINVIKNWVKTNSYNVAINTPLITFPSYKSFRLRSWYKNSRVFGQEYDLLNVAPGNERKFWSNFQDTCVSMPKDVPSSPVKFNAKYSGATFNLESNKYFDLDAEKLAGLLQLIQFQFNAVELTVRNSRAISSIRDAIKLIEEDTGSTGARARKYFVYIGVTDPTKLHSLGDFDGVHLKFCQCKNDQATLKELRHAPVENIGISFDYGQVLIVMDDDTLREIIRQVNYTIIHVDFISALFKTSENEPPEITFRSFMTYRFYDIAPNPIFDLARAARFYFTKINPNITVYLRLAWPITNDKRSVEQSQKLWAFVHDFSNEFDFPFFIFEAFDHNSQRLLKYGWWKLGNNSDAGNPMHYIDKQAEIYNLETLKPNLIKRARPVTKSFVPLTEIVTGVVAFCLVLLCTAAVVIYRLRKRVEMFLTKKEVEKFEMGILGSSAGNDHDDDFCSVAYDKEKYEISNWVFNVDSSTLIGSGFFGFVYKSSIPNYDKPVAVKVPKISGKVELLSVLREIKLMSFVGEHENILKLVGAYTKEIQKGIVYIVTEICDHGSFLDYLRKMERTDNPSEIVLQELYQFCLEIAKGMHYLGFKKVVHGDLSTRNVLLDDNNVCKICDFGLSRKLYDMDLYVKTSSEPVPWKWMAIETLERSELSVKSDIWSLGVTFWEIFSFGEEPYQSLSWDLEFSKKLTAGLRLPKPSIVDLPVYEKLLSCWSVDPEERSRAQDLVDFFQTFKNSSYTTL